MQKWSPEPFDALDGPAVAAVAEPPEFSAESAVVGSKTGTAVACQFRSEAGFTDPKSLMNSLTTEERAQVYELVQLDVADEYDERERELRAEFEQGLRDLEQKNADRFAAWTEQIAVVLAAELRGASAAAAELAVQIAAKIVRRTVAADPTVLTRAIEATSYKIAANEPLTIQASVEDAEWLQNHAEVLSQLHIGEVVADRRIESGGCLVQCQGREWDASLKRQLGSLEDIVTEMLATAEAPAPLSAPLAADSAKPDVPLGADPAPGADGVTETEVPDVPELA